MGEKKHELTRKIKEERNSTRARELRRVRVRRKNGVDAVERTEPERCGNRTRQEKIDELLESFRGTKKRKKNKKKWIDIKIGLCLLVGPETRVSKRLRPEIRYSDHVLNGGGEGGGVSGQCMLFPDRSFYLY